MASWSPRNIGRLCRLFLLVYLKLKINFFLVKTKKNPDLNNDLALCIDNNDIDNRMIFVGQRVPPSIIREFTQTRRERQR